LKNNYKGRPRTKTNIRGTKAKTEIKDFENGKPRYAKRKTKIEVVEGIVMEYKE
jgi:hypothetical protein